VNSGDISYCDFMLYAEQIPVRTNDERLALITHALGAAAYVPEKEAFEAALKRLNVAGYVGLVWMLARRDGMKCQICGKEMIEGDPERKPSIDHIIHRSKGGGDEPENLRLACVLCNSQRGDRDA
jgi:hypothetical protein